MIADATMSAIVIGTPDGPEALKIAQVPRPHPGPGEVLIRVAAAGVNYPDVMQRQGRYDPPAGHSTLPGLEVSGLVVSLGQGVSPTLLGASVVALTNGGGYAEFVSVPAGQVLPRPEGIGFIAAAAVPETFFTVQQTLVQRSGLGAGMSVLIHGAAGGIGSAAIRIACAIGAIPIAIVSGGAKAAYAHELGAQIVIDHTQEDFVTRALEATNGRGADRIISIAGGELLNRNIAAAAKGGTIIQLAARGGETGINLGQLLGKQLTLFGSTLRPQTSATKAAIAAGLKRDIWPPIEAGRIRIGRVQSVPLAEASRAHQAMERREHFGKIVLVTPWGSEMADKTVAPLAT